MDTDISFALFLKEEYLFLVRAGWLSSEADWGNYKTSHQYQMIETPEVPTEN